MQPNIHGKIKFMATKPPTCIMGVPGVHPVIIHFERWDFPEQKPSSYGGTPPLMETPHHFRSASRQAASRWGSSGPARCRCLLGGVFPMSFTRKCWDSVGFIHQTPMKLMENDGISWEITNFIVKSYYIP